MTTDIGHLDVTDDDEDDVLEEDSPPEEVAQILSALYDELQTGNKEKVRVAWMREENMQVSLTDSETGLCITAFASGAVSMGELSDPTGADCEMRLDKDGVLRVWTLLVRRDFAALKRLPWKAYPSGSLGESPTQ